MALLGREMTVVQRAYRSPAIRSYVAPKALRSVLSLPLVACSLLSPPLTPMMRGRGWGRCSINSVENGANLVSVGVPPVDREAKTATSPATASRRGREKHPSYELDECFLPVPSLTPA